jgi:opacity protein-like surface antigen
MKKLLAVLVLLGLCCIPALAQDNPKFEVFGGYSRIVGDDGANGFSASVEARIRGPLGVVGEFGYFDMATEGRYSFLAGPRISYRKDKLYRPFGHVLLGGVNGGSDEGYPDDTLFTVAAGGGVDMIINERFSVRPLQIDVVGVRYKFENVTSWTSDFRYSAGFVVKFGSE